MVFHILHDILINIDARLRLILIDVTLEIFKGELIPILERPIPTGFFCTALLVVAVLYVIFGSLG